MAVSDPNYLAYLLRLRLLNNDDHPVWRLSLECPSSGNRHNFASLEDLFDYLRGQMTESEHLRQLD